jgi:hypothetical protein
VSGNVVIGAPLFSAPALLSPSLLIDLIKFAE